MRTRLIAFTVAVFTLCSVGLAGAGADPGGTPNSNADFGQHHKEVCPTAGKDEARCHSEVVTKADNVTPAATTSYSSGYGPGDLSAAYKYSLPLADSAWAWNGQTIAIVDAYHYPSAATDLAAYRAQFHLPPCSAASGCFRQVNQTGGSTYPAANVGWAQEAALDLDMASAVCPNCKLVLLEATSNGFSDLFTAVDTAANVFNANAISNSYGGSEFSGEASYESHYNHPGSAITVSSGDSGYGVEFPAASRFVTAVGGTHLTKNTSTRGWTETAWSGAGSGCSRYIVKPTWQQDSACAKRSVADVSAVADPATGVAVYDSYGSSGAANWYVFGGTSVAAPVIAGFYALAGNGSSVVYGSSPYGQTGSLFDVTSGSNGTCGTLKRYLCKAGAGYDGPTGLGTPNGTGAF